LRERERWDKATTIAFIRKKAFHATNPYWRKNLKFETDDAATRRAG